MKKQNHFAKLLAIALLFVYTAAYSQSGTILGTVFDTDGKITLPGANVYIKGSPSTGTVTDLDGEFILSQVPAGVQILIISYTGYTNLEQEFTVEGGKTIKFDPILQPMSIGIETVVITGQAMGQTKAINQQLNSDAIANIVSADKMKELPDVNAAEAISRLPGVAINRSGGEGSKIVVRGLDPKFTAISINGVRLPSTSGTDRSVDLSLISPELLSGIELFKSPTPDMDGDALGGSVNLSIIKAPRDRKISLKALGGHNALANTTNDYKLTGSIAQRVFNDKIGLIATVNSERFNRSGETIGQNWGDNLKEVIDTAKNIFAQQGNSLSYNKTQESRKRNNASVGIDFQLGQKSDFNILGIYSRTSRERYIHNETYNVGANYIQYTPGVTDNSIDLYSGSFAGSHKLTLATVDYGAAYSEVQGKTPIDFDIEFRNDRGAFSPEIATNRTNPAQFYDFLTRDPEKDYLLRLTENNSSNSEKIKTAFINVNIPVLTKNKFALSFKTGSKYVSLSKDRDVFQSRNPQGFYLLQNTYFSEFAPEGKAALGLDPTGKTYLSMQNFQTTDVLSFQNGAGNSVNLLSAFDVDKLRRFRDLYKNKTDVQQNFYANTDKYTLNETVFANYAMFKLKVGDVLTVIPGIRHERSDNTYRGIYSDLSGDLGQNGVTRPDTGKVDYGILLPHLHVKIKPLSWFDIRASYSTTLARPDYSYLIPFTDINRSAQLRVDQGVPNLQASTSKNYDLYLTAYNGKFGLFSIGGFYKNIANAFYPFTLGLNNDSLAIAYGFDPKTFGGASLQTYKNSPDSYVKGIEMEIQSSLNFLPGVFKKFVVSVNYSRLYSQTTVNSFNEQTEFIRISPFLPPIRKINIIPFERQVDLIGQAAQIFNASLGFDHKGFSARSSASYQGTKLSGYAANADKDRYNQGFYRFDLAFKQKFGRNLSFFLNINNLSDQKDISFFRNESFMTSTERFGSTATFGAEYIIR